ncbi:MAG: YibE/F family protein [Acidimicrobiales bacterium]
MLLELPDRRWELGPVIVAAFLSVGAMAVIGLAIWWPRGEGPQLNPGGTPLESVDGTVESVAVEECPGVEAAGALTDCQRVTAVTDDGDTARFTIFATDFDKPELDSGDEVVLVRNPLAPPELRYRFWDFQRTQPLLLLGGVFVVAVVVLARWQGVRALTGIVVSFVVLLGFLSPPLLRGNPALPVALAATVITAFGALYLAHGVNLATTAALAGTLASLAGIAVLGQIFVNLFVDLRTLTGLTGEESKILRITAEAVDLRGLLVAGIVIGALGVLDDVTVTQVSAVVQLRMANPDVSASELYRSVLKIGRDHIASTVNTLVLAYAGASLPVLLLYPDAGQSWARVTTGELVAMEIVRPLVGSVGLILTVPLTTALAAVLLSPRAVARSSMAVPRRHAASPDGRRASSGRR